MAFKMSYSFEGNYRTRPEQNLSGASKKISRDLLLQKTHEERRKRQEQRLKLQSAQLLQSYIRSYLARKHKKDEERCVYDNNFESIQIPMLLSKLVFFYDPSQDNRRLYKMSECLFHQSANINRVIETDSNFAWLVRRWLVLCLKNLSHPYMTKFMLNCLDVFACTPQAVEYLTHKGYYVHLRTLLDKADSEMLHQILGLIYRPFQCLDLTKHSQDIIMSEFCNNFLKPVFTSSIQNSLIPYLKNKRDFPYEKIIRYLNSGSHLQVSNSLFYCILALEPDDYEPTGDTIQVLSVLSSDIHNIMKQPIYTIADDSDDESEILVSEGELLLSDYLHIMNKPERVRKLLIFFEQNINNEDILVSLTKLCHNLLLVHKNSVRKFLLLYKLGLNGNFLNKLWNILNRKPCLEGELRGSSLLTWKDCHTNLSVFCNTFTFYTETLTDKENSDTSETFSQNDLYSMAKLLKNVSVDLVETAFPMCRASTIAATPEILHLYSSCLNCVKMLYMLDIRKQFCPPGFWTAKKIHVSQDLSRRNYLVRTIKPFHGLVVDNDDDEQQPPPSTIEQRSLAILQELPFLIEFNTRVLLMRDSCKNVLKREEHRIHHEIFSDNLLMIRRTHLYEDAFEKVSNKTDFQLRHRLRIHFINSVGLEEPGVDGGGIFKEFINEVLKTAFDPNRGFFLLTADNTLYPNPNVHLIVENYMEHYYFIGRLVGKAIFENILVDLPLAEFFLAKLLVDRASAHYLKSLDPVLYRNLLYLRDYTGDVSDLGLDFTAVTNDLGETKIVELKPGGRDIQVTNENRLEYIQRLADFKLNVQLKKQCTAFKEGLNAVVPLLWLRLFSHHELQVIIGGDTQEIDISDLREHATYGGEFTVDHPTIKLFWRILRGFTETQKKMLLKFVTSCSRPPLLGFKELNPPFCIQSAGSDDRMPTSSTCLNLLKIPVIKEEEALRNKILAAIEQQTGFELS